MDLRDWVPIPMTTDVLAVYTHAPQHGADAATVALRTGHVRVAVERAVGWLSSGGWLAARGEAGAHTLAPGRLDAAQHVLAHTEPHRVQARRAAQFERAGRHARHSITVTADRAHELAGMADALDAVLATDPEPDTAAAVRVLLARVRRGGGAADGEPPVLANHVYACSIRCTTRTPAPPITIPDPPDGLPRPVR